MIRRSVAVEEQKQRFRLQGDRRRAKPVLGSRERMKRRKKRVEREACQPGKGRNWDAGDDKKGLEHLGAAQRQLDMDAVVMASMLAVVPGLRATNHCLAPNSTACASAATAGVPAAGSVACCGPAGTGAD